MARRHYSSIAARTTLASGVDDTTTTFVVTAVSNWPASYPYTLIVDQDTVNEEIVEVTARSGTTLTVTRGVDGSSAVAHDAGAAVNHGVSARDFDEPNDFINGTGVVTSDMIVDGTIVNADVNASAAIAQSKIADLTSDLASKLDYATPANAQTGTAYTFVADDAERMTTASNGSAVTLTIPPQSSVAWGAATILRVVNYGAGEVTVAGGSGVTVTNTSTTIGQYEAASAIRTAEDAWTLVPFSGGVGNADFSDAATGTYTDAGIDYKYITFTSSGTLTVTEAGLLDFIIVAGGGGGGGNVAGGGGAGGYIAQDEFTAAVNTYTITVGAGGAGGAVNSARGTSGNSSSAFGFTASGGGGGGTYSGAGTAAGLSGGSGGGGATVSGAGGTGTASQGNDGGDGHNDIQTDKYHAGGGGGAGSAGVDGNASKAGNGGSGTSSSITGTPTGRAGGGGGGCGATGTIGTATDGGGDGGKFNGSAAVAGTANTGGGGGGGASGSTSSQVGGNGGSGVVIVRVRTN